MLQNLSKNQTIHSFLSSYPKEDWNKCIEALVVLGITKVNSEKPRVKTTKDLLNFSGIKPYTSPRVFQASLSKGLKHLQKVESKIKHEVKHDIQSFRKRILRETGPQTQRPRLSLPSYMHQKKSSSSARTFPTRKDPEILQIHTFTPDSDSEIIRIADEFLCNPYTSQLSKRVHWLENT